MRVRKPIFSKGYKDVKGRGYAPTEMIETIASSETSGIDLLELQTNCCDKMVLGSKG